MKFFLIIISLFLNQELIKGDKQLNLNQYTLVKGPIVIEGVKANASGLTYSAKRDSLFVVLDQPQRVVEITFDGSLKRKIDLNKFQDTEGIAWVTEDIFAIAEEGKCNIVLTELGFRNRLSQLAFAIGLAFAIARRCSPWLQTVSAVTPSRLVARHHTRCLA